MSSKESLHSHDNNLCHPSFGAINHGSANEHITNLIYTPRSQHKSLEVNHKFSLSTHMALEINFENGFGKLVTQQNNEQTKLQMKILIGQTNRRQQIKLWNPIILTFASVRTALGTLCLLTQIQKHSFKLYIHYVDEEQCKRIDRIREYKAKRIWDVFAHFGSVNNKMKFKSAIILQK